MSKPKQNNTSNDQSENALPTSNIFTLTKDQQTFFDLIQSTNNNYFLNGPPGSGKSVVTRALLADDHSHKNWIVCAPTGLAAINANGRTLHSTFRLPVSEGIVHPSFNNFPTDKKVVNFLRFGLKYLLIDEISMVRCDMFDFIDRLLRDVKRNDLPFGGVQVVAVGDFYQLPPVTRSGDKAKLIEAGWESPFVFSANVWRTFQPLTLTEVLRQKGDRKFIDVLNAVRTGKVQPKHIVLINDRVEPDPEDIRIRLYAWNAQAESYNQSKLKELPGDKIEFEADSFGNWPDFPADPLLGLKIGAQVMVKKNKADRPPDLEGEYDSNVVNGTLGVVVEINGPNVMPKVQEGESLGAYERRTEENKEKWNVVIETNEGHRHTIYRQRWEHKIKEQGPDGKWEETVKASFEQMPLALAWAVTIHKSQGQTFDAVHIDASKVFAAGQFYVALSRCRTLEGVTLQSRVHKDKHFKTDPAVLAYSGYLEIEASRNKRKKIKA
jgi:ATP-dependent DNA helicase PIF1